MQSQIQSHPSSNHLNPTLRRPPYTIVTYGQHNYRILTKQHQGCLSMLNTWTVFWSTMLLLTLAITFIDLFNFNRLFILIFACISSVIFTAKVLINRNELKKLILCSSINLMVFLIVMTLVCFLFKPWMIVPTTLYILAQFIISCVLMKRKGHIFGKCIVLIQLLIISLKVDQKIQASWTEVLFGLIIIVFFTLVTSLFVGIYLIYAYCNKQTHIQYQYKFQGILFILLSLFSFTFGFSLPILNPIFNQPTWIFSLSFSIMYIIMPIFIYLKTKQIVVLFCTLNEVKAFNQIIQIQKIIDNQLQNTETSSKVTRSKSYCYRISSNWFSFQPQPQISQQPQIQPSVNNDVNANIDDQNAVENPQIHDQIPQCLICLQSKAELIWMPCGHLTVCMSCCQFMFLKKNLNCVLCKKVPEQLFLIDNKLNNKKNKIDEEMEEQIKKNQIEKQQKQKSQKQFKDLKKMQQKQKGNKNQSINQIIEMDSIEIEIEIQMTQNDQRNRKTIQTKQAIKNSQSSLKVLQQQKTKRKNGTNLEEGNRSTKKRGKTHNLFEIIQGYNVKVI